MKDGDNHLVETQLESELSFKGQLLEVRSDKVKLPDGMILIPGVISHTTVLVEHPELVAQRIERFARAVGRENIIVGSDCGFATFAGSKELHPSIVWAKFASLVEGARIASERLWKAK